MALLLSINPFIVSHDSTVNPAHQPLYSKSFRGQWLGLIGVVALTAMTWLCNSYLRMVLWPWVLIWQVGFLAFGIWLIWQLYQFQIPFYPLGHGFDWAIALTGIGLVICSLASEFREISLWNILLAAGYVFFLYCLVPWARQAPGRLGLTVGWVIISIVITAIISLALWQPTLSMWQSGNFFTAFRNFQPLGHHNFVGGFFALAFPLMVTATLMTRGLWQWIAGGGAILVGFSVYASGSRGALLGLLTWLLVAMIPFIGNAAPHQKIRRSLLGAGAISLGLLMLVSNPRVRNAWSSIPWAQISASSGFLIQDGPILDRYFMLKTVANIVPLHPLTGIGPGAMARVSNLYRPVEAGLGLNHVQQLHNTPAQFLGEMGFIGLILYTMWAVLVVKLWWKLQRQVQNKPHRLLVFGIGGSYLTYMLSSLTDYQLENIAISALLTALLALLLILADSVQQSPCQPLGQRSRRGFSLFVFIVLVVAVHLWAITDVSLALGHQASRNVERGKVATALDQWSFASAFTPWDPTFHDLAGEHIYNLLLAPTSNAQPAIKQEAIAHFQAAAKIAPNDAWFNYNVAALMIADNPTAATAYAEQAIRLLPRSRHYMYYLLGLGYLKQGNVKAAARAFALEAVEHPEFLVMSLWQTPAFAPLQAKVLSQALALHDKILQQALPETRGYTDLYAQTLAVRWWYQLPLPRTDLADLSPVLKALQAIDISPEQGMTVVDQLLTTAPNDARLKLLKAWLSPNDSTLEGSGWPESPDVQVEAQIRDHFNQYRDVRDWLGSLQTPVIGMTSRQRLDFAYRNGYAQQINLIIPPANLETPLLLDLLGLFPTLPREFPALDRTIKTVQQNDLNLPGTAQDTSRTIPLS